MHSEQQEQKSAAPIPPAEIVQPLPNFQSNEIVWQQLQKMFSVIEITMHDDENIDRYFHAACLTGNIPAIQSMVQADPRLLLTPHPASGLLPLHQAVLHDDSLRVMIDLLDRIQPGFALACLLRPAGSLNQLPLEYALHHGDSLTAILKLMTWMGSTISSIFLTTALVAEKQPFLDAILLSSILKCNPIWANQVITWGANPHASLQSIAPYIPTISALANPTILAEITGPTFQTIYEIINVLISKNIPGFSSLIYMDFSLEKPIEQLTEKRKVSTIAAHLMPNKPIATEETKVSSNISPYNLFSLSSEHVGIKKFFEAIKNGEQEKIEEILKLTPRFALITTELTDLSNRTFKNITALQFAVWSLDFHMWSMILKYVPNNEAIKQCEHLEKNGTEHGFHFNPSHYINFMNIYIKKSIGWDENFREQFWCVKVGGSQRLFPVGFVNEFCRTDKSFNPGRSFLDEHLTRTRSIEVDARQDDWFTSVYKGGKLGATFAIYRANGEKAIACSWIQKVILAHDRNCIDKLYKLRLEQRQELLLRMQSLKLTHALANRPS